MMEQRINIAKLLKDCPKGMELDCSLYDNVTLVQVKEGYDYPIVIETPNGQMLLSKYGCFSKNELAKCIIFPKGETTWEGFHKPFEDGDIVAYGGDLFTDHLQIFIFKDKKENNTLSDCYLMLDVDRDELYLDDGMYYVTRFATEEEKKKLFDAIKENGYRWDAENKTLENLVEPWTIQYAKDGDVLAFDDETIVIFKDLYNNTSFHSYCHIEDGIFTISKEDMPDWWQVKGFYPATEEQCTLLFRKIKEAGYHWNAETKTLEKLPKFKVGDIIQDITGICKVKITEVNVEDKCYLYKSLNINGIGCITFNRQDDWELVPNKFDVINFEPFMKVLVRSDNSDVWECDFFSSYNPKCSNRFHCIGAWYNICIPYIGNEHLRGTTDDCDDYYKL